jgi:hypothetical protein
MKSLRLANIGILLLASAVLCYGQHGHGGSAAGGHMGGPPSGVGSGTGNSGNTSGHGSQAGSTQSQKPSPQQLLDQNKNLTANLQKLLPAGTTPQQACQGFTNLGRCVAAIHVAHNLGIPFSDLAGKLTGPGSESLGKAIQDLRPQANAGAEKKKAEKQAKADMNGSTS